MTLKIITDKPGDLLSYIKKAIDKKIIDTWEYDKDGDFTHTPSQWRNKAWLRPNNKVDNSLDFEIIFPKDAMKEPVIYGVYHGRFIEMLLTHFSKEFKFASAAPIKN